MAERIKASVLKTEERDERSVGSKPTTSSNFMRGSIVPLYGAVAQLGERLFCKQEVVGSFPSRFPLSNFRSTTGGAAVF